MTKKTWWWLVAGAVGVLLIAGGWAIDRGLKQRDHPGLATFLGQMLRNYPASFSVEAEVLVI